MRSSKGVVPLPQSRQQTQAQAAVEAFKTKLNCVERLPQLASRVAIVSPIRCGQTTPNESESDHKDLLDCSHWRQWRVRCGVCEGACRSWALCGGPEAPLVFSFRAD